MIHALTCAPSSYFSESLGEGFRREGVSLELGLCNVRSNLDEAPGRAGSKTDLDGSLKNLQVMIH